MKKIIFWRCYLRSSEWRGETKDFEYFFRLVKVGDLWQLYARGGAVYTPASDHEGYTTLLAAKRACADMVAKAEGGAE